MIIVSNNKSISFNINGYEYPNHKSSSEGYDYDANWLICEIKYSENELNEVYRDACLLTYELEELISALTKILKDEEEAYISDFMEPYLQISIAKVEEKVLFIVQFVYDTSGGIWKKRIVSSVVEKESAMRFLDKLVELQKAYPER